MAIIYRTGEYYTQFRQRLTGYSLKQLISFTGIDAIHEISDIIKNAAIEIDWFEKNAKIEIETDVVFIRIIVNTKDKIVENQYIRMKNGNEGQGVGILIFEQQQETLFRAGYKKITCLAYGDKLTLEHADSTKQFNGYITWIKAGFTMTRKSEDAYYINLDKRKIPRMPLNDLLEQRQLNVYIPGQGTKPMSGEVYWQEYGESWEGEFELNRNSKNVKILHAYLVKKYAGNFENLTHTPKSVRFTS
ncbi:hypothetical protein [Chitinophaga filiformis]|uniref:Uncharacterized protein n=1 Tax=Chitinophaga filiformis TaxID=104663 RepID=A0A1G7RN73_CHIFI|nr:hypothetical protein [Chitinophaga filiformis]SDG12186.1 hypothetical protein SAMN04488121_103537 [Chitinophaga filiformis]